MINQFEQCPRCGKITEGIPAYGVKRQAGQKGIKMATKKVLIWVLTPLILTILGPFGTITGLILACIIVFYIDKAAGNITESIDMSMYSSTPFEFKCSHCGNSWNRTYEKGLDFTTDYVLKWQKDGLVRSLREDADSNTIGAVLCGFIAFACGCYCFTHKSSSTHMEEVLFFNMQVTDTNWTWWILFIIGVGTLVSAINCGKKSRNNRQEADNLEHMSISNFRHSNYRAGNPFVGLDRPLDIMNEVNKEQQSGVTQKKIDSISEEHAKPQVNQLYVASSVSSMLNTDKDHKRCPYCGEEILSVAKKCKHCGEWLNKETEQQKEMTRCSVCGEKVEKGLDRCPICHEPLHTSHIALDIEEHTKACMMCGEEILEFAKKCKHCGEWQRKPKEYIDCSICGEKVEKGLETCPYCHEPLSGKPHIDMMICPTCGETIPADSKICPECNEPIED